MHHRAATRIVDQRNIFFDTIKRFHLEPELARPHRSANTFFGQYIANLVRLDGVMELCDAIAELLGHIEHLHHFVCAIAMHLQ